MKIRSFCSLTIGTLVIALLISGEAAAAPITHAVSVNVYQLCDDAGQNCASTGPVSDPYFGTATNLIWSQAGIAVYFNFVAQINSTLFSYIDDNIPGRTFADLSALTGGPSATEVDMFLVRQVANGFYGESWLGLGGFVMSMDSVMAFNGGQGRMDTIAHELGHNFGLVPIQLGGDAGAHSGLSEFLMASGLIRTVPLSLSDIAPNGAALDFIPEGQADFALESSLLYEVPEPAGWSLMGAGVLMLVGRLGYYRVLRSGRRTTS